MATAAELAILLKLHDEMSADLKKAEANVKSFGGTMDRVGRIASGVLLAAGIRTGLRDVVNLFESATAAAAEHARVESQVQAVLKSTGGAAGVTADQVFALADSLQKVTRFSDEEVASAEALLLTFTRIGKDIFPQVTETVLDMATALGEDTKSAAIQLGKALQDPILGVTALRRVGVAFTADQQKQIKALVESGHGMEAQRLILMELNTEFGGSAKSLTESEKRWRSFNVAIDEGKEKLGAILTGGLIALGDWFDEHQDDIANFREKLRPAFDAFQEFAETKIGAAIEAVSIFLDTINSVSDLVSDLAHGRWQSAWEDFLQVVTNFGKSMLNNLVLVFGQLPNIVIDAMNSAIDAIRGFKIPDEISTHIFGSIGIPGGGSKPFENVPPIPRIPTKAFSLQDSLQTLEKLGEAANRANPPVRKVVDDFGEAADNGNKLADALKKFQDEMGKVVQSFVGLDNIKAAVSALFRDPTAERAQVDLKTARLQYDFDALSDKMRPALDRLSDFRDSLSAAKGRLDDWGESISARRDALSEASSAISDQISQLQANFDTKPAFNVSGGAGGTQGLTFATDPRIRPLEEQKRAIDAQAKALDREEKARQAQITALDKQSAAIQRQTDAIERQLTLAQRDIDKNQRIAKLDDDRKNVIEASITASNALLLTTQTQNTEAGKLATLMEAQSRLIKEDLNPSVTDLVPELRTAQTEMATLSGIIKNDVGGALLTFARNLSTFKLPEFKDPNKSGPDQSQLGTATFGPAF